MNTRSSKYKYKYSYPHKFKYKYSYPPKYRVSGTSIGCACGIGIGCESGILSSLMHTKFQLNQSICNFPKGGGKASFEKRKKNHYKVQGNLYTKIHNDPLLFQEMENSIGVLFAPDGKGERGGGGDFEKLRKCRQGNHLFQA